MKPDISWTPEAIAVVARACDHYGGWHTWERLRVIRLTPVHLSGLIPWMKGVGSTFPLPATFEVSPREGITRFLGFPTAEHVGIFDNGAVRIERLDTGEVVSSSPKHRDTFRGLRGFRRWAPLDALYFFGYALAHYHSLPFSLFEGRLVRASVAGSSEAHADVLDIELPAGLHTHCRRQQFHFDRQGTLRRHDYHAEVVGYSAHGAHFWNQQTVCNGFPVALERRVVARLGSMLTPVTALRAEFTNVVVELAPPLRAAASATPSE